MLTEQTIAEFRKLFDIPLKEDEKNSGSDYFVSAEQDSSRHVGEFDDRVKELSETISDSPTTVVLKHDKKVEKKTSAKKNKEEKPVNNTPEILGDNNDNMAALDSLDEILESANPSKEKTDDVLEDEIEKSSKNSTDDLTDDLEEKKNEEENSPKTDELETEETDDELETEIKSDETEENNEHYISSQNNVLIENDRIVWLLKAPSKSFIPFYQRKSQVINDIIGDRQIPYKRWIEELINSKEDTSIEVFEPEPIHTKMELVQRHRDRVCEILLKCNSQYYLLERGISLLRGSLALVKYEKPSVRQDGIIYEHMRDIELYFDRLKTIHRSAAEVLENLDSACTVLSRKLTIALPKEQKNMFYDKLQNEARDSSQKDGPKDEILSDYDSLPDNARSNNKKPKTGKIDWI